MKLWNFLILLVSLNRIKNASAELYDDQPKILVNDGNLVFESADSKNITVKLKGRSRFLVNDLDVLTMLSNVSGTASSGNPGQLRPGLVASILQQITTLRDTVHRQSQRIDELELGASNGNANSGNNGTNTTLSDRQRINRIGRRVTALEQRLANLTERLTKDHCKSYPCQNGGTCFNLFDTYRCECPENYEGPQCTLDVNECARYVGTDLGCQNGATCVNTFGAYECTCTEGWHGKNCNRRKVDCLSVPQSEICGQGICVTDNSKRGYSCICNQGWRWDNGTQACTQDVNECEEMRPHCSVDPKVVCINTPGSFVCGPCPSGYRGNGFYCEDVDECEVNNGGCSTSPRVECINTRGSHRCGQCPLGYEGDGRICIARQPNALNQCDDSSICNSNAVCYQYPNSPPQCTCKYGFTGNGFGDSGCIPIAADPCVAVRCRNGGTCVRNGTTAYCTCPPGTNPPLCDRTLNSCDPNPCRNGGNCTNTFRLSFRCTCPRGFTGLRCENQLATCGGVLSDERGTLRYPTDPAAASYQHNSRCAWLIRTNITKVLNITFTSFDVEFSNECRYDWLQIHDGRTAASHIIGRFCGSQLPKGGNIISTHNSLYLWFRSDNSTSHSGFELTWETIDPVCGGEQNIVSHGTIASPGSPGNYPINSECEWILLAPAGKRIQFLFYTLMIEAHTTCGYDYLEIHSGIGTSSPSLGKFCNSSIPAPLLTPGNVATIHFHTDGDSTDAGFQIAYSVVEGIPGCGGVYTAPKGDISSPTNIVDGTYKHNLMCDYVIRMPSNSRVRLEFKKFGLEESSSCKFDSLEIFEGDEGNEEGLIGRYCGTTTPPTITSSTNVVTLKFTTDWSTSDIGFELQYQLICGGIFTADEGVFSSPNYPNNYDADLLCEYDIIAPQGKVIFLNILDFEIEQHSSCEFDYLQIFDSSSAENSTSLGRYCGDIRPGTFTSSFNHIHLQFASDGSVFGTGFQANYTFVDVRCGGLIKDAKELVKAPLDQTNNGVYESNALCKWLVIAPKGHVIQMNILNFELELDNSCKYDYLTIYNNGSGNGGQVGPFCGTNIPKVITTVDNIATIVFVSDSSTSKDGFTISFNFIDGTKLCGGNFHSLHGKIKSPGTGMYLPNKECEWTITVPHGQQIEVNFKFFDIENHSTCRFDGLEIRNGGNSLAPLLSKICGSTVPPPFRSMGNQLYFRFYSDSSRSGTGFELEWDGTSAGCGGILTTAKGALISPNYPLNYPHNSQCEWRITVNEGSSIHIVFSDLDLEANSECRYDYLEIFDGPDPSARSFGKFCEEHPMHIETSSNHAMLRMNTDESHSGRGFHVKYSTNCNRTIEADSGVIESPNFPEDYPSNLDCAWTIKVSRGNKVNLQFSHFSIENDNLYHNETGGHICKYDYVMIYDYDSETNEKRAQTQKSYCNKAPELRTSTTDSVVVVFHTDQAAVGTGFRLEWYNEGCGGKLTHPSGGFTSPDYPRHYQHNYVCTWEIAVEYGQKIKLTIHDFEIERSSACQFDSLVIANDRTFNSSVVAKVCQTISQPMIFTSESHQLFVRFTTDESHSGKGFNVTYESMLADCGGLFTAHNGVIKTPSYPSQNYENNKTCEWLIRTDEAHSIEFTLTGFDLEETQNCSKDSLEISDPIFNRTLWRGCGSDLPDITTFRSRRNEMLVRLKTDDTVTAKGFIGNFSIGCGGRFVIDDGWGEIAYRKSSENVDCEWSIIASDPSKHVTLTFTYGNIFLETDFGCLLTVQVFEGDGDELGARRASFCGSKTPPAIISNGNALTVKLNSSSLGSLSEFDLHYSVLDNACGGTYSKSINSEFASPNYPASTPLNTYCIWTLTASAGNKLSLEIKKFDVASSPNCNENYLEIRQGNANGELIGVFCGDKKPETIDSSQAYWIKYRTDESATNNGFLAEYKYLTHSDLQGVSGRIESPNFPNFFRREYRLTYRIIVQQGFVIRLVFNEFSMDEEDPDDCYSNIQIYNGYDSTAVTLGEEICQEPTEPIISETNIVFLHFHNGIHAKTRFRIEWTQVDRNASGSDRNSACGNEVISLNNVSTIVNISSPGYPHGYDPNLDCKWTILSGIPSYHPIVSFNDVDLEDITGCGADYVAVSTSVEGGSWREAEKLCMMDIRERKVFHGTPSLQLEFHSDYSTNETGFMALTYLHCGGVLTDADGIIDFDATKVNTLRFLSNCMWNITVRRGRKIQFEILDINIRNASDGCSNFISIKNGHDDSAPYLGSGQFCTKMEIPQTTGNRAFVSYKVNTPFFNSFRLRYAEVQHECGGQITLSSAYTASTISSPNYPNIPPPHVECTWIIIAPVGREIRVDFLERFDLTRGEFCDKEFVKLREGSTSAASLIGTYCGSTKPQTQYTKSNVLRVRFVTDVLEPKNGFKANVSIGVCGGTVRTTGVGYVSSPKYPGIGAYPSNVTCDYRIIGPPNTIFTVEIIDIDLPGREDESRDYESSEMSNSPSHGCDTQKDHFVLYSVMPDVGTNETLLDTGTFCGSHAPKRAITSDSNEILVRFRTFVRTNKLFKGFRLFYNASRQSCGGELNADSGIITSIAYPSRTLNRAFCEWRITVRKGRRVKLEFLDLDFVPPDVRNMQRLIIYSDFSYASRMMFITSNNNPGVVYSSDNKLMITAWIRAPSQNRGFKIRYSSEEPSLCEGDLNADEGYIYPPNIENATSYSCTYERQNRPIVGDALGKGTVAFYLSNLDVGRRVVNCRFAATNLAFSRASAMVESEKYLARICGNASETATVLSPFPDVRFEVKQSPFFGKVNFSLHYKVHNCGGLIKGGPSAINITNPPPSTADYKKLDCAYHIKYEEGFAVALKIQRLRLKLSCEQEHITIYNGPNAMSPVLARICGDDFDRTPLISQKETVYIEYHTENFNGESRNSEFSINVDSSSFGCGGILNHLIRRFSTPLYDKPYPSNTECMWEIRADSGYQVGLYFTERFFIEASDNCTKDFLEFYDFVDNEWIFMKRVCGRDTPQPVNSTSTRLRVLFHSDGALNGDGFVAQWDQNCGGVIAVDTKKRVLTSPRYPLAYEANLRCNYTFVTSNAEDFVNIKFLDFNLEAVNGKCIYDNVTVYKWLEYMSPQEMSKVGVFCGTKNPGNFRYKNKITIIFVSDQWVERKGFQLEYSTDSCGGVVTSPTTIASVPIVRSTNSETYEYLGAMSCVWNITAPPNHKIVLKFEKIALDFSEYCSYDFVEIFSGALDDEKNRLVKLCNNLTIPPISVLDNQAVVKMRTEQSKDYLGFSAVVYFQEKCDQAFTLTLSNPSVVIDISHQQTAANLECTYKISGDPLSTLRVRFDEMHLSICDPDQRKDNCSCDYLEFFDGNGPFSRPIGRYCGHDAPIDIISTTSSLYIRFATDSIRSSNGFKLTITMQESPCGPVPYFNFTNPEQAVVLTSPRVSASTGRYPPNIRCQWTIEVPERQNIEIIFALFELEDSEGCRNDSLRIEDDMVKDYVLEGLGQETVYRGHSTHTFQPSFYMGITGPTAPHVYCGSVLPHDYFSTTNKIRIYFETNSELEFGGFDLTVRQVSSCNRNYTALQGRLMADVSVNGCHTTITVPENYTISLYFARFYFYANDCEKSFMKIYDGTFETGALLRTLCGYSTPDPVFSAGNRLSIRTKYEDDSTFFTRGNYDIMYVASERSKGPGCGGEIFNYGGLFTSPQYPSVNRTNYDCTWTVRVPSNLVVALKFQIFDMGSKLSCGKDYVEFLEENEANEFRSIKSYCGDDEPAMYVSSRSQIKIHYVQTVHFAGTGWMLHFMGIHEGSTPLDW